MKFIDKWGGLPFLLCVWLIQKHYFGFEITVIVMLAVIMYEIKLILDRLK